MRKSSLLVSGLALVLSFVLLGAGNEREKLIAGAEDVRTVDPRRAGAPITPTLKSTDVDVVPQGAAASAAPNYFLDWYSVNGGGEIEVASANFKLGLSVGQAAAGEVSGPTFTLGVGFWYGLAGGGLCPITLTGDVNLSGSLTSADIIAMVNFVFKGGAPPLPCEAAADVNCNGSVTSADVIFMVGHVFKGGPGPCDACTSPLAAAC